MVPLAADSIWTTKRHKKLPKAELENLPALEASARDLPLIRCDANICHQTIYSCEVSNEVSFCFGHALALRRLSSFGPRRCSLRSKSREQGWQGPHRSSQDQLDEEM